jgi:ubiquinone/menaquinone biosynthesis C-methylase UbiE
VQTRRCASARPLVGASPPGISAMREMATKATAMESLFFDGLVDLYEETRSFDHVCFENAVDYITDRFPPQTFKRLLEPAVGTGRIAFPLAQRGYLVVGVDISGEMLEVLQERLARSDESESIRFQKADVRSLPFADEAFDIAVVVHLFYFVRDWKRAVHEILRVVRHERPVILMGTGMGMEIPALNERYKRLCAEQGCTIPTVGVKSTREVVDYLVQLGCQVESVRDQWQWTSRIRLDTALDHIKSRAYSFTAFAPDAIHLKAVARLEAELKAKYGDLTVEAKVPNQIYLVVVGRG